MTFRRIKNLKKRGALSLRYSRMYWKKQATADFMQELLKPLEPSEPSLFHVSESEGAKIKAAIMKAAKAVESSVVFIVPEKNRAEVEKFAGQSELVKYSNYLEGCVIKLDKDQLPAFDPTVKYMGTALKDPFKIFNGSQP